MSDQLLTRLRALDPVPSGDPPASVRAQVDRLVADGGRRRPSRRAPLVAIALAAVALPGAAFAHRLGGLLGLTNEGTPVATHAVPEYADPKLAEGMDSLAFPGQMRKLGTLNGYTFYGTRNAQGTFCFAIDGATLDQGRGVGCSDLAGDFPSAAEPIAGFPGYADPPHLTLLGFAADGIAKVEMRAADGSILLSADVHDNLYAARAHTTPQPPDEVVALDANGTVIYQRPIPPRG